MKKVAVILSTYNGEKYLTKQLDSLVRQVDVDITLFVRDDGSIDNSKAILDSYFDKLKLNIIHGDNVGFERSFMEALLSVKDEQFDFFTFCDQDDIWDDRRTAFSVDYIEKNNDTKMPFLYCSNQRIIDENDQFIRNEMDKNNEITKYSSLLSLNQRGCVMLWNRELQSILRKSYQFMKGKGGYIPPHDTWVSLIAYAVGSVYNDSTILMSYRVSSHNTAGSYVGISGRLGYIYKKFLKTYIELNGYRMNLALLLSEFLSDILKLDTEYISELISTQFSIKKRINFLNSSEKYFQGLSYKWKLYNTVLIMLGRI